MFTFFVGLTSFVACGKKDEGNNNACSGYPSGYVQITDPRMLAVINGNYGYTNNYNNYNNGYSGYNGYNNGNNGAVCVDQNRYQQIRVQVYGASAGQSQINCQAYPYSPECQSNYNGGQNNGGYNTGNTDPYCDYYPNDPSCRSYYGGW